jgi:tRNA(fMet)-specific endonuclease VapC
MVYILDTNILIYLIRENPVVNSELSKIGVFKPQNTVSISIASFGEILSFALQNNWGERKKNFLERLVDTLNPIPIFSRDLINAYAEIDTYSKGKLIERPTPSGLSARTMGKNDLWIAATTYTTKANLITNDNDFDHLHGIYFNVIKIKSSI